eukprot:jgi/Botrbrau1/2487/Bobra.0226s0044.1
MLSIDGPSTSLLRLATRVETVEADDGFVTEWKSWLLQQGCSDACYLRVGAFVECGALVYGVSVGDLLSSRRDLAISSTSYDYETQLCHSEFWLTTLNDTRNAPAVHNIQHAFASTGATMLLTVPVLDIENSLEDCQRSRKRVAGFITLGWKGTEDDILSRVLEVLQTLAEGMAANFAQEMQRTKQIALDFFIPRSPPTLPAEHGPIERGGSSISDGDNDAQCIRLGTESNRTDSSALPQDGEGSPDMPTEIARPRDFQSRRRKAEILSHVEGVGTSRHLQTKEPPGRAASGNNGGGIAGWEGQEICSKQGRGTEQSACRPLGHASSRGTAGEQGASSRLPPLAISSLAARVKGSQRGEAHPVRSSSNPGIASDVEPGEQEVLTHVRSSSIPRTEAERVSRSSLGGLEGSPSAIVSPSESSTGMTYVLEQSEEHAEGQDSRTSAEDRPFQKVDVDTNWVRRRRWTLHREPEPLQWGSASDRSAISKHEDVSVHGEGLHLELQDAAGESACRSPHDGVEALTGKESLGRASLSPPSSLKEPESSPVWLSFAEADMERSFLNWMNERNAKSEMQYLLLTLACDVALLFFHDDMASSTLWWASILVLGVWLMLILFFRPWYVVWRECCCIVCTITVSFMTCWIWMAYVCLPHLGSSSVLRLEKSKWYLYLEPLSHCLMFLGYRVRFRSVVLFWSLPMGFMALLVHAFIITHVMSPEWHVFYNAVASISLAMFHIITLAILRTIETHDRRFFVKNVLLPRSGSSPLAQLVGPPIAFDRHPSGS